MNMNIPEDYKLELLEALAARKDTPRDVKDLSPKGRPNAKGGKKPGAGIPKGVTVFDADKNKIGSWDSVAEAGEAMNTPAHRIKVACQKSSHFYNMERVIFYAEYFELPKQTKSKQVDNY